MARIAVGGLHHETNSFAPEPAAWERFVEPDAWPGLSRGAEIFERFPGLNIGISGFLAAAKEHDLAPLIWANAGPSAPVTEDAYERLVSMLLDDLAAALPVDAVYLCLHGAMVCDHLEDGEGELLRRVRDLAGATPVVCSLDLHANVTGAMAEYSDGMVAYRSYPHLDMAETGARALRLLERVIRDGPPARAMRKLPYLIPISHQSSLAEPANRLYGSLDGREGRDVWSISLTMGFPPADIAECGPAVFAYGREAEAGVEALFQDCLAAEGEFAGNLWEPADAVARAIELALSATKPVILADTQDNPGAGANSDTTGLLRELVAQKADGAVLGLLYDPDTAAAAHAAGTGATLRRGIGAISSHDDEKPYDNEWFVETLSDGRFEATGPFYGGGKVDLGPMAVLRHGGVRVVVASRKQQAADRAMFAHLGIDPAQQKILALKSSVHFRADFQPIAEEILIVEAPGSNIDDPARLPYTRLRPGVRLHPKRPVR